MWSGLPESACLSRVVKVVRRERSSSGAGRPSSQVVYTSPTTCDDSTVNTDISAGVCVYVAGSVHDTSCIILCAVSRCCVCVAASPCPTVVQSSHWRPSLWGGCGADQVIHNVYSVLALACSRPQQVSHGLGQSSHAPLQLLHEGEK